MKRLAIVLAAIVALAGCAPTAPDPDEFGVDGLVGMWKVQGAGVENSWLRIDADSLSLWLECGVIGGNWDAQGRSLVFAQGRSIAGCYSDTDFSAADWFVAVRAFEPTARGIELHDADGKTVATLVNRGMPKPHKDAQELYSRPMLNPEEKERLLEEFELPDRVDVVQRLEGMYRQDTDGDGDDSDDAFEPDSDVHVVFFPDSVFGFDGCAGWSGGSWIYTDTGQLVRARSEDEQAECFVGKGLPLDDVETIGQRGDDIVFFDRDGREIAAFVSQPL